MSAINGQMTICDRCGHEHFSKHIGTGEADGGYTRWDKFEALPDTWLYTTQLGYLCPTCAGIFRTFIYNFMNGKDDVANWTIKPEDEGLYQQLVNIITAPMEVI